MGIHQNEELVGEHRKHFRDTRSFIYTIFIIFSKDHSPIEEIDKIKSPKAMDDSSSFLA